MEMTNMQADMILGQLNTIYAFLMKNSELVLTSTDYLKKVNFLQ